MTASDDTSRRPGPALTPAQAEWADELTISWVAAFKKSATTLALLEIVHEHGPVPAAEISRHLEQRTGWTLTERGLYRTLRRLADSEVLQIIPVEVARTGVRRHDFQLTDVGRVHRERIRRMHDAV